MKILVVTESRAKLRRIAEAAALAWPSDTVEHLLTYRFGPWNFAYPRGLRWANYPNVAEPQFHWGATYQGGTQEEVTAKLMAADRIIFACDPDHSGITTFTRLVHLCLGDALASKEVLYAGLTTLTIPSLVDKLASARPSMGSGLEHGLEYGRTKQYFDYNFNLNSHAVFGRTLRDVGVTTQGAWLSKYQVQAFYDIASNPGLSEARLTIRFADWKGTGKYQRADVVARIGSPASYSAILEGLSEAGLTEVKETPETKQGVVLTALGEALLDSLHKDCEDPDLPFRLHHWCEAGLDASKSAIDRYLRTYFGKQIRYAAKHR